MPEVEYPLGPSKVLLGNRVDPAGAIAKQPKPCCSLDVKLGCLGLDELTQERRALEGGGIATVEELATLLLAVLADHLRDASPTSTPPVGRRGDSQ